MQNKAPGLNHASILSLGTICDGHTYYEVSSVYDNNSLPRPYRVDVQKVSMRSFFSFEHIF